MFGSMEECSSLRSSDSAGTSEEYEIVESLASQESEPQLNIANNGNMEDLQHELTEVMREKSSESSSPNSMDSSTKSLAKKDEEPSCFTLPILETQVSHISSLSEDACSSSDGRMDDRNLGENNPSFSQVASDDDMERVQSEDGSGDYTIFNRVTYLGAASINAPRSEAEIQRNMAILNAQAQEQALEVSVSVPSNSEGYVIIYDATTSTEMTRFKIHRILFCARGKIDTTEARCFAFTSSHGDTQETAIFQCHVFRCQIPEAVARVLITFAAAFRRVPRNKLVKKEVELDQNRQQADNVYLFDISLEIKEEDSKGNFNTVPRDKEFFKLRCNTEKQLVLTVTPTPPSTNTSTTHLNVDELNVERCFGLLVAPGRRVKNADMNLLEMVSMGSNANDKKSYVISGHWDPSDSAFVVLNRETPRDRRIFMTVAIDLVIRGIQEPVRFVIETKVRVYPHHERFWYFSKKPLVHLFSLKLKQVAHSPQGDQQYVVTSVDNLGEVERWRPSTMSLSLNLSSLTSSTLSSLSTGRSPSIASIETPGCDEDTDDDEPLLSGSGEVSKDCPQGELDMWRQVLPKLQAAPQQLPKGVSRLVKRGIPEALRGEVWQLLAGCSDDLDMMETYRVLITKDCASEQVILRDINRTFPAHDYFKEAGGVGQDALYKISKAYAVYDEEVGYCQGLSFLAAALLLHMPEEQTFCVLVKIMFEYGLRDLFKDGFEILHMRFYQLAKLMEEQLPELWLHFQDQGVEIHMFASQWFLTLYTAKFPLFMVFHYLDLFLLTGIDSVFQVALALLQMSKKELISSDFEGILKYFRVSLPKKYRNEDVARQLYKVATSIKVKKLKKYEKEYLALKEQEALQEDPVVRLERENRRLLDDNMRLERENDDLAHELVTSKINMRHSMDKLEDKCDNLNKEVVSLNAILNDAEEEKKRLLLEANQVKELLKREVDKGDMETQRNNAIITDYKKICSQLSERLDKEQAANTQTINMYKAKVSSCETCSGILSPVTGPPVELGIEESPLVTKLNQQVRELELELAQTKLALVESECKNQDLTHQLSTAMTELQATKNTWFQKTLTSISSLKERTASTGGSVIGNNPYGSAAVGHSSLQRQHSRDSNSEKM
ncbi:rab GTPase-activating protein 1 isoform X3 [Cherax quadricarinatus]|uniref:rab GTPase-activating protein 1 isoform X3 n=1 Tax=Cherax quadricarinatus TaxID=27406 RepID=UPI002377D793|nr:rab GTPase-activating protein 1-like isoform X3 [Cherax quadricarinatus]